jgi:hypothetical protein
MNWHAKASKNDNVVPLLGWSQKSAHTYKKASSGSIGVANRNSVFDASFMHCQVAVTVVAEQQSA